MYLQRDASQVSNCPVFIRDLEGFRGHSGYVTLLQWVPGSSPGGCTTRGPLTSMFAEQGPFSIPGISVDLLRAAVKVCARRSASGVTSPQAHPVRRRRPRPD